MGMLFTPYIYTKTRESQCNCCSFMIQKNSIKQSSTKIQPEGLNYTIKFHNHKFELKLCRPCFCNIEIEMNFMREIHINLFLLIDYLNLTNDCCFVIKSLYFELCQRIVLNLMENK
jgi:hypothetical protein